MNEKIDFLPTFSTEEEAWAWLDDIVYNKMDEHCVDNWRFAYQDDEKQMEEYEEKERRGCCGSTDRNIIVGDRYAVIGCNFGH